MVEAAKQCLTSFVSAAFCLTRDSTMLVLVSSTTAFASLTACNSEASWAVRLCATSKDRAKDDVDLD